MARSRLAAALSVCLAVTACASADTIIDHFTTKPTTNWPLTLTDTGSTSVLEIWGHSVPEDARYTQLTAVAMDIPGVDRITTDIYPANSLLEYESSSGATGQLLLEYGTALPSGGSGMRLGLAPGTVNVRFLNYDFPSSQPLNLVLTGYSDTGSVAYGAKTISAGAQTVSFDLSSFQGAIEGLELEIDAPAGADYRLDYISVVPEPATLSLLALGGLALLRRRRNRA